MLRDCPEAKIASSHLIFMHFLGWLVAVNESLVAVPTQSYTGQVRVASVIPHGSRHKLRGRSPR